MRWFFLLVLMVVVITGNALVVIEFSLASLPGMAYFNALMVALGWIWWHAYFQDESTRHRGLEQGAFMVLALVGIALMVKGFDVAIANDCGGLRSESKRRVLASLLNTTTVLLNNLGLSREAGAALLLGGSALVYRSWIRVFQR